MRLVTLARSDEILSSGRHRRPRLAVLRGCDWVALLPLTKHPSVPFRPLAATRSLLGGPGAHYRGPGSHGVRGDSAACNSRPPRRRRVGCPWPIGAVDSARGLDLGVEHRSAHLAHARHHSLCPVVRCLPRCANLTGMGAARRLAVRWVLRRLADRHGGWGTDGNGRQCSIGWPHSLDVAFARAPRQRGLPGAMALAGAT